MRTRTALPCLVLLLVACGGSHSEAPMGNTLSPTNAQAAAATVVSAESTAQASPSGLPMWVPLDKTQGGTALGLHGLRGRRRDAEREHRGHLEAQ